MKINWILMSAAVLACSPEKTESDNSADTTSVTTPSQPTAAGEFEDMPGGAFKEPFQDDPSLVRVYNGSELSGFGAEGIYKDGKKAGSWIEYHPNKLVKSITPYIDGKREGIYLEFNENGQIARKIYYHNNMRNGLYKEYDLQVKEQRLYVNDKIEGKVSIYYPDGKIMEEGMYKNGTRDGVSKWYDQEGRVTIEYEYKNGVLVKK